MSEPPPCGRFPAPIPNQVPAFFTPSVKLIIVYQPGFGSEVFKYAAYIIIAGLPTMRPVIVLTPVVSGE